MKYKVTDSFLIYTTPNSDPLKVVSGSYKRDDIVDDAALTDAGFDAEFLIHNKSIEKLDSHDAPVAKAKTLDDTKTAAHTPAKK